MSTNSPGERSPEKSSNFNSPVEESIRRVGRVVVGVDGSQPSIDALRFSLPFASALGASLVAITAWKFPAGFEVSILAGWSPESEAQKTVNAVADAVFDGERPPWFHALTREGSTSRILLEESEAAELLVVGSRGLGGFTGLLLGSVSKVCAEHAHCPVLIVRSPK